MDYDPYAKLSEDEEGWLALAVNEGGQFASHAISKVLLDGCNVGYGTGLERDTAYYMLRSAIAREDKRTARMYVNDWRRRKSTKPTRMVSKFVPGDHYHTLDQKFDTLQAAQDFLTRCGYSYGGLIEEHVYKTEGD